MVRESDWQLTRNSLVARNSYMFNNDLISDVNFVVYSQKSGCKVFVPAHKYVLAISSPVFLAMFYSDLAVAGNTVDLPDCDSEGLTEFLRYIYCDRVELALPSAIQALYLAKKYLVPALAKICVAYIKENATAIDALDMLPYALKLDEQELAEKLLQIIDDNPDVVFSSRSFLDVNDDLLENILNRDTLCVKEIELFKSVQRWLSHNYMPHSLSRASSRKSKPNHSEFESETPMKRVYSGMCACKCENQCNCVTSMLPSSSSNSQTSFKIPKSHASQTVTESRQCDRNRNQLIIPSTTLSFTRLCDVTSRLLKTIRFPLMSEEDFKSHVIPSNLLSHQDIVDLLVNFGPVPNQLVKYPSTPRKGALRRCARFATVSRWFLYSGSQSESVIMSVNTPIKLYGIRLYGQENCHYRVKLNVYRREIPNEKHSKEGCYKSEIRGSDGYHGYDVVFDLPFRIENDADYAIDAVIAGPPSAYGKEAHRSLECGKVKLDFKGEENSLFQNFGVGQFAEVIFFEL